MYLIVGLGNPGEKYKNNRHNVGYTFIDYIAKLLNCYIVNNNKKNNNATIQQCNNDVYLAKPQTFMNLSGKAITELFKNFKLKIENLIVIHDDLDIPLGKFKVQKGTGPLLHNGIESIEKSLGTKNFWRIRIGIDGRTKESWIDGETYVLQDFTAPEKEAILQLFPHVLERLKKEFLT